MANKRKKTTPRRSSGPRKSVDQSTAIQKLKKQVAELRKQLKFTEMERDGLRPLAHEYLKSTIAQEEIESGLDGEYIEGSLMDFWKEAEKEYKSKNGKGKRAS